MLKTGKEPPPDDEESSSGGHHSIHPHPGGPRPPEQCDQIGRFLKVLGDKYFLTRLPKMHGDFLGYLEKHHFSSKSNCS